MRYGKTILGAVVVLAGMATSAQAQQFGVGGFAGNAFGGGYGVGSNAFGYNSGFGGVGFGNGYGYNNLGAYGYSGGNIPYYYTPPTTYNNLGGLAGSIATQTGRANSYRYGYGQYPIGRRR